MRSFVRHARERRSRLLFAAALTATALAAAVWVVSAFAGVETYAGPKTWLVNYDAASPYDGSGSGGIEYYEDAMDHKSCTCLARVAFIDTSGSWHDSLTDYTSSTRTQDFNDPWFMKEAYCKNNSSVTYTAQCEVAW